MKLSGQSKDHKIITNPHKSVRIKLACVVDMHQRCSGLIKAHVRSHNDSTSSPYLSYWMGVESKSKRNAGRDTEG